MPECIGQLTDVVLGHANILQEHATAYQRTLNVTCACVLNSPGDQLILIPERTHTNIDVEERVKEPAAYRATS